MSIAINNCYNNYMFCILCSLQRFKEWLSSKRKADHLQTWFEQPGEPHYKTVFTEFVPNDTSWQLVVLEDEDINL